MKTITNTFNIYEYSELKPEAKEKVKEWYLNDPTLTDMFYENCKNDLEYLFPKSDLDCTFSLAYCQGDGFNTIGTIIFDDFLEIDNKTNYQIFKNYTEKEMRRLNFYFKFFDSYTFEKNNHYCYSCKFIDIKYRQNIIDDFIDELKWHELSNIDKNLIERFICDMLDFFEKYDNEQEKAGYNYLYEISEEDLQEYCEDNDYYFLENGEFYC